MTDKKGPNENRRRLPRQLYNFKSVASDTDSTGLTPALPLSEEEYDSYSDINPIPTPGGTADVYEKINEDEKQ